MAWHDGPILTFRTVSLTIAITKQLNFYTNGASESPVVCFLKSRNFDIFCIRDIKTSMFDIENLAQGDGVQYS